MFLVPSPATMKRVKEKKEECSDLERTLIECLHGMEAETHRYRTALEVVRQAAAEVKRNRGAMTRDGALLALTLVLNEAEKVLTDEV